MFLIFVRERLIIIFVFCCCIVNSQEPITINILVSKNDSITKLVDTKNHLDTIKPLKRTNSSEKITDNDLKNIDSLLVQGMFNSPLFEKRYVIDNTDTLKSFKAIPINILKKNLQEINSTTPFNIQYNIALEKIINNYIKYRKKYYPAIISRAKYYFPIFEQYLDRFNIPIEIKYLAIIESSLNPKAKSRVGATGLWQFMYGTAKQFKLIINSYVDQRQDPIKSTIAACKYLSELYKRFSDWNLVLAAYNSGPGNVLKAIKRSGGYKNYWNIRPFLPIETAGYVPAFYATIYILKYANELGIKSNNPKFFNFQTDTIRVNQTIKFDYITKKIGVSNKILTFLNPQYKIGVVPYIKNKNFYIRLPRNKIFDFLNKEKEIYALANSDEELKEKPLLKHFKIDKIIRYRVRNGDYLGKIARRFGVRISQIKRWNNMRSSRLRIGQRLFIYPRRF